MSRLVAARPGPLREAVAEARAQARRARQVAELAWLLGKGPQYNVSATRRTQDGVDKAVAIEQRFNALVANMGTMVYPAVDGNNYTMVVNQQVSPHNQGITSTAFAAITGLSAGVAAATYTIDGHLVITLPSTWSTAGQPLFQFTGPAISEFDIQSHARQIGSASLTNAGAQQFAGTSSGAGGYGGGSWTPIGSQTTTVQVIYIIDFWGDFTFSATGTLGLDAAECTNTDSWTVDYGWWRLAPTGNL